MGVHRGFFLKARTSGVLFFTEVTEKKSLRNKKEVDWEEDQRDQRFQTLIHTNTCMGVHRGFF
jgi:hypothetical protein